MRMNRRPRPLANQFSNADCIWHVACGMRQLQHEAATTMTVAVNVTESSINIIVTCICFNQLLFNASLPLVHLLLLFLNAKPN